MKSPLWAAFAVLAALAPAFAAPAADTGLFTLEWREVAKDVWVANRADALRYPVVANTTVVIGDDGVLVFDGGGYAAQGEQVLAQIRKLTDKPVTHLVISHWHGDHHRGTGPILQAFPQAEIIAHLFACAAMADGPERRVEAGEAQLSETYEAIASAIAKSEWFDGSTLSEEEKAYFSRMIADFPEYEAQLALMKVAAPTLAIDGDIAIDLGGRVVELKYFGRANTAGDIALWLPKERIIATGDIVVAPLPYGFGSYPSDWAATLAEIAGLKPGLIIPGHGAVMMQPDYILLLADMLGEVAAQAEENARAPETDNAVTPKFGLAAYEELFTLGDPVKARLFSMFFKQPIEIAAMNVARGRAEQNEKLDGAPDMLCAAQ